MFILSNLKVPASPHLFVRVVPREEILQKLFSSHLDLCIFVVPHLLEHIDSTTILDRFCKQIRSVRVDKKLSAYIEYVLKPNKTDSDSICITKRKSS